MRILLEAATESEGVAQLLETIGHEVVVADPNYTPMYGERSRRVKTDHRDVAALAEACRLGLYRQVHRRSPENWAVQWHLTVREQLVWARTRSIQLIRCLARMGGVHISRAGHAETFVRRLDVTDLPPAVQHAITPLREMITMLNGHIAEADAYFKATAAADPRMRRLMSMPGVGPITAAAFVAAIDEVSAFRGPGQVTSYLGLVPREYSSGEQLRRGRIVPSAHPCVQALLVEAGWRIWRSANPETRALCASGRRPSESVVASASPRLRWRAEWPGFSTRCGVTRPSSPPREFGRGGPPRSHPSCGFSRVVKLGTRAREEFWPHARAGSQRAPRPRSHRLMRRRQGSPLKSADRRMIHLAESSAGE